MRKDFDNDYTDEYLLTKLINPKYLRHKQSIQFIRAKLRYPCANSLCTSKVRSSSRLISGIGSPHFVYQ